MQTSTASSGPASGWHVAQWGLWGWLETVAKLIAIAAGILAFFATPSTSAIGLADNPHLAALSLLALLLLASVFQLVIRMRQREVISLIFAILNLIGHACVLAAVLHIRTTRRWPVAFGGFYVLGQLIKLQFLRSSGYTEGGADSRQMLTVTGVIAALYAVFTLLVAI